MMLVFGATYLLDGHKVNNLTYAINGKKARNQHIGFWNIQLLMPHARHVRWCDTKETAFVGIQKRTENTWRIETRYTAPVYRAILAHQCHGMEITNHSIIFYGLISRRRCRRF